MLGETAFMLWLVIRRTKPQPLDAAALIVVGILPSKLDKCLLSDSAFSGNGVL
jgi:hypothetical protein